MKQFILNSIVGHFALTVRDKFNLLRTVCLNLETVGDQANNQIAAHLITKLCQPSKIFIDVGAHIGSITSEVIQYDSSIKVIAIEAIPEKVASLRKKFPEVEIIECAVGESDSEVSFFVNKVQSGYSSLGRPSSTNNEFHEIKVPMKRLDTLVPLDEIDAIKIDVEGAELGVIRSAEKILSTSRPTIMFESAPVSDNGLEYTKEALWQQFSERDYLILVPNRVAHNDDGLSMEGFLESHLYPRRTTNYFAIPKERRVEIRDRARCIIGVKVT